MRDVTRGTVLSEADVERRTVPTGALPSGLLPDESVLGTRAAIALSEGTVLTLPMTSSALAKDLGPDERLVQVPVEVGSQLAEPGGVVDVIGQAPAAGSPADLGTGAGSGPSVLCEGARVVLVEFVGESTQFTPGSKVTLVTLAVTQSDASLVVGAATQGPLGLVLSP